MPFMRHRTFKTIEEIKEECATEHLIRAKRFIGCRTPGFPYRRLVESLEVHRSRMPLGDLHRLIRRVDQLAERHGRNIHA